MPPTEPKPPTHVGEMTATVTVELDRESVLRAVINSDLLEARVKIEAAAGAMDPMGDRSGAQDLRVLSRKLKEFESQ